MTFCFPWNAFATQPSTLKTQNLRFKTVLGNKHQTLCPALEIVLLRRAGTFRSNISHLYAKTLNRQLQSRSDVPRTLGPEVQPTFCCGNGLRHPSGCIITMATNLPAKCNINNDLDLVEASL